jgi:AraC-like DNA-binding protein/ligand-binding sensor protein
MPENMSIPDWFDRFREAYRKQFGFSLVYTDHNGSPLTEAVEPTECSCRSSSDKRRLEAAEQTLYWGETIINLCCDDGYAMWAVPVMLNDALSGCLVVQGVELENREDVYPGTIQKAADSLLEWAVRENFISSARVELSRQRAETEKARFYALEQSKHFACDDLRSLYLREEPELLMAIKQGNKKEARGILNRILVSIYSLGEQRMDLLKSCVLELIVMMSRAAVEAGADPSTLLGTNYRLLSELAGIEDEEDLAQWVRRMLESLIEAIRTHDTYPHSLLLSKALAYMRDNLGDNLRRDEVARHAGVSPGHLAAVMTERMGRSFTEMLLQMRVDRARDLLRTTDLSLSSIALECGFYDQSHLNKIFRKVIGKSPGAYRRGD